LTPKSFKLAIDCANHKVMLEKVNREAREIAESLGKSRVPTDKHWPPKTEKDK